MENQIIELERELSLIKIMIKNIIVSYELGIIEEKEVLDMLLDMKKSCC